MGEYDAIKKELFGVRCELMLLRKLLETRLTKEQYTEYEKSIGRDEILVDYLKF